MLYDIKNELIFILFIFLFSSCNVDNKLNNEKSKKINQSTAHSSMLIGVVPDTTAFEMIIQPSVYPTSIDKIYYTIVNHLGDSALFGDESIIEYYDVSSLKWVNTRINENQSIPIINTFLSHLLLPYSYCDASAVLFTKKIGRYRITNTVKLINKQRANLVLGYFELSDDPMVSKEFVEKKWGPAHYKDGYEALDQFITSHITYPAKFKGSGLETSVICEFTIDTVGNIKNPQILKEGVDSVFDMQVLDIVKLMSGKWIPACDSHGRKEDKYTIKVSFKEDNSI